MAPPSLSRYEIVEELGQGGMSVVYRAKDRQLSREVAVKILHEFLAKQEDARRRFHREAVAVAKLRHPGILEIFDYSGPDAQESYIVTELIDGPTLREWVEARERIEHPELAALIAVELAKALQHAHDHGVVHRDLKPENIMIARSGELKLMDFGIAQLKDDKRLTLTGTLLGSPAHMAPEVIDGKRPDKRSDLFSLGTILYWLATGELPFSAPNPSALFKQILDGQFKDPQQVEPKIGNHLSRVIKKLLAPNRESRYDDARAVIEALMIDLEEVGLAPTEVECRAYLSEPNGYVHRFEPKLIGRLTEVGRTALKNKQIPQAMDRMNRVLALDPTNKEVRAIVNKVTRQEGVGKRLSQAAAVLLVLGGGVIAYLEADRANERALPNSSPVTKQRTAWSAKAVRHTTPAGPGPRIEPLTRPTPKILPVVHPPPSASAEPADDPPSDPPVAEPPPQPTKASVRVRIGNSFADIVVDGNVVHKGAYNGSVELSPGRHELWIAKPGQGRSVPKVVVVEEDGSAQEETASGARPVSELMFVVPKPTQTSAPDWIPPE